jgi:transposase
LRAVTKPPPAPQETNAAEAASLAALQVQNARLTTERDTYRRLYLETMELARKLELGLAGRGRERELGDTNPLSLLSLMSGDDTPPATPPGDDDQDKKKQKVAGHERAKPTGRQPLPESLPRVEIEVVPPEVVKAGTENFERIGEDVSETVERRPASLVVVRTVRPKFVPKERARGDETRVVQGEPLELPIPKGLAGPSLLADTIVKRWSDHTPLHRMERIYGRDGLTLARQTICGWHLDLSRLVAPLVEAMWKDAYAAPYLCVDATGVLVQHPEKCRNGHFFVVAAPERHVLFAFSEKHNNAAVDALLGGYEGVLVADAHTVYDHLYLNGKVREAGCWAHTRRYFFKALSSEPRRARVALALIGDLFAAERKLRNVSPEVRKAQRKTEHEPIVAAFERWCDDESLKVLDETPLAKALGYAKNQRGALRTFLSDGCLPLDNNWSERELRRIAWGRDNWLFIGSEDGGDAAANFISLLASCQLHGLEPHAYLRDLFCLLPTWPASKVLDLSPARWEQTLRRVDVLAALSQNVFRKVATGVIEPAAKK